MAPTAAISSTLTGAPGATIFFSGQGSTDPQGQALTYAWAFGDGTSGSGVSVSHIYAAAGVYTVTLTVTNTSGLGASTTGIVHVAAPPVANAGGPYSGYTGIPLTFNGAASTDPQGLALTYYWNFGDQTTGTGVAPVHTYGGYGTFTVTLTVTNANGISSTASATSSTKANITLPPPAITLNGPYTGKPTLAVMFTSKVVEIYDSNFTYLWSFGDGATSGVPDPMHTYAAAGTYSVSLTVTGAYAESATATSTATIVAQGAGPALTGAVMSGSTPVVGAHVHLLAANTTGYGQASVPLLTGTGSSDAYGAYVASGSNGAFMIPAGFSCATHEQVYVYATGGSVGGNTNADVGLLSTLGACGYLGTSGGNTSISVNEVTTVAAAYAMAGYSTGPAAVSSPATAQALTGIGNAFLNAANLVSYATGAALLTTPATNGTAPQATVNTLANVLHGCVSAASSSATACANLFSFVTSGGTAPVAPADTAQAMLNIAHNQGANVSALYSLQFTAPVFGPALTTAPHDWAMAVSYSGILGYGTEGLAVDANGNVWVLQYPRNFNNYPYLTEYASNGDQQVGEDSTCNSGTEAIPDAITIDSANNLWLLVTSGSTYIDQNGDAQSLYVANYCTVSSAGVMLSPPGGYYLGGNMTTGESLYNLANDGAGNGYIAAYTLLERSLTGASLNGGGYIAGNSPYIASVGIDGGGNFWLTSPSTNGIVKLSKTGALVSPAIGYAGGGLSNPGPVALDSGGNVWAINTAQNYLNAGVSVSKLSSAGAPLSGTGFTNGLAGPYSLAIDGGGNAWVANGYALGTTPLSVTELAPGGSPTLQFAHETEAREYLDGPQAIAVDSAGSVWLENGLDYTVTQFVGASTPVVTPLAANLATPYNAPASRP